METKLKTYLRRVIAHTKSLGSANYHMCSILLMKRPENFTIVHRVLVEVINCKAKRCFSLIQLQIFVSLAKGSPKLGISNLSLKHVQVIERCLNIMMQLIAGWSMASYL